METFVCLFVLEMLFAELLTADYDLSWCNKCFLLPLPFVQQPLLISHCFILDLSTPGHNQTVTFGISHQQYLTHTLYQYTDMPTVSVNHRHFTPNLCITAALPSLLI